MKKIKRYFRALIYVLKDILFQLGNEKFRFEGLVHIKYRNYLPEFINKKLIINMLIRQGYLKQNAIAITDAYLSYKRKKTLCIENDPILRFLSGETHIRVPAPAQEIIDAFAVADKEEVLIAQGETLKEQIEYAKKILNERKKKSTDSSDKEN